MSAVVKIITLMNRVIVCATNILAVFTKNYLFILKDLKNTSYITICAIGSLIVTVVLIIIIFDCKMYLNVDQSNSKKISETVCKSNSRFHKQIVHEFHRISNNCSSTYSSIKCLEFSYKFPELINVKVNGATPFHEVCFRGNDILVEYMLAKGADPKRLSVAGENALCMALHHYLFTSSKDFKCLDILQKKGVKLNTDDEWYKIFLALAMKEKNTHLIKWLQIHSSANIDKNDKF
ncbi:uncharacterized protein LOC106654827 [Trichogramma pretiosum]|uniref:uncharacterized protein LOC106654827 n=1 Tax=Trichogramma pretiosum TaxID=7493 RepID=UPI0006C9833C|nr:uncharacterized protein LOC106654827 [Trichogramma pretiosum]XP_014230371.1 uncharacterized protein LOC106654827 [Trichogramma pretiosum]